MQVWVQKVEFILHWGFLVDFGEVFLWPLAFLWKQKLWKYGSAYDILLPLMCLVCLPDLLLLSCWVLLGFEQTDFFCLFVLTGDVFGNENTQVYWCTSVKTSMVFAPLPCLSRRTCKSITACCILPSPTIFPSKQKVCGETTKKGRLCNKMSRAATFSLALCILSVDWGNKQEWWWWP